MRTIYVRGLSWRVTSAVLKDWFGEHGNVASAVAVYDPERLLHLGYGFVRMHEDAAAKAIAAISRSEFDCKRISAEFTSTSRRYYPYALAEQAVPLFAGNLAPETRSDELAQFLRPVAEVVDCRAFENGGRPFALFRAKNQQDADALIERFNGRRFIGRTLRIAIQQP